MLHMEYNINIGFCQVPDLFLNPWIKELFLHITPWKVILELIQFYAFCGT